MHEGLHVGYGGPCVGTVHGDLKPANVIVGEDLTPRIMDFGLARCSSHSSSAAPGTNEPGDPLATAEALMVSSSSGQSVISGTPAYMSPEQLSGDPATPASDVFAFGLLLFELATAERALPDAHLGEIQAHRQSDTWPLSWPPPCHRPGVQWLSRCWLAAQQSGPPCQMYWPNWRPRSFECARGAMPGQ